MNTTGPGSGTTPRDGTDGTGGTGGAADAYTAVVNDEGQYALWPAWRPLPGGWHGTGVRGDREECLAYIEREWTDMRPRSLRGEPPRPA
ncbi:MbtH family protein [Streptomyces sp. NPDC059398]|uniref:MbtH family protein n=1 Tax=Streptomyces sp. NPDC059398 TaxID=3346820 RepID=UPI0036974826